LSGQHKSSLICPPDLFWSLALSWPWPAWMPPGCSHRVSRT